MLSQIIQDKLSELRKKMLILDIETSSYCSSIGEEINIRTNFDEYVLNAKVKWFGAFSYKNNQQYYLNAITQSREILNLLNTHDFIIGFNSEEFDFPILVNNGLTNPEKRYTQVDLMQIMGTMNQKNKKGYGFKGKGELMGYKFKNNSLKCMAEAMQLEHQKGDIDYKIFHKNEWTEEETKEIKKYLYNDVMIPKQMFDKLWWYWLPFAELLSEKFIYDLSWIRSSIASLTYKAACKVLDVEPTYAEKKLVTEEMGGNVLVPKYEEAKDVWYIDFASLYPHIFSMFNLPAEINEENKSDYEKVWHGNKIFQVKGYYNISKHHVISKYIAEKLKQRIDLQKKSPDDKMIYTLKILLNCFSFDTQVVMADNSIKDIKDCKIGEYVWSINPRTLYAEKKKIKKTFEYDYNGEIHCYNGRRVNFKVTPNHRFLLHKVNNKTNTIDNADFYESNEIINNYKLPIHKNKKQNNKRLINILDYFPKDYFLYSIKSKTKHARTWLTYYNLCNKYIDYNGNNTNFIFNYESIKYAYDKLLTDKDLDIYIFKNGRRKEHRKQIYYDNSSLSYLVGIYLAEGSASKVNSKKYVNGHFRGESYSIQLSQNKNVNPVIYNKIKSCLDKCNLKYTVNEERFKISGSIFYDFLINNFGKLDYKCFINKSLFDTLNLSKVWEGLIDGDGTKNTNLYTTKYDCLKNDFIELCMRLGYTFTFNNDGCWRIRYNKHANIFRPTMRTVEHYNEKVYCVEIEDNNTLMAGRDGKFHWSGNSLYGVLRSPIFEKIHTPNCGWDCCWLGQQIQDFTKEMMESFGFETIYGDTDSLLFIVNDKQNNNKEYVQDCLNQIIEIIKDNVPFPVDTFNIKIEHYLDYIMFPFSDQPVIDEVTGENKKINNRLVRERKGKKKNYAYVYQEDNETKVKLVGLPLIKDNATPLGLQIYNEVLKQEIIKNKRAKFTKQYIDNIINDYLKKKEVIESLAVEYKVNKADSYKTANQIQAQISKAYFAGESGTIRLIKNNKVGKVGKGTLYCTIEEAYENNLTSTELDLEKIYNELEPFIIYEPKIEEEIVEKSKEKVKKIAKELAKDDKALTQIAEDYCNFKEIDISLYPKPKNIIYPFKWPGNKKDLLSILQEVFKQSECTKIHEAFAGSAVFSLNTEAKSYTIADTNKHLYELWRNLKNNFDDVLKCINDCEVSRLKIDQDYYNEIREHFNKLTSGIEKSAMFYLLLGSCTNNLARFNLKEEFNQTWGKRTTKIEDYLTSEFKNKLFNIDVKFQGYEQTQIDDNTLLYLDPPYLLSNDCYTANSWGRKEEDSFLLWLSTIKSKWCLSNIITKGDKTNDLLKEFAKRYNIYYLSKKYNAKVGGYDKREDYQSQEVLVTNFPVNFDRKIEVKKTVIEKEADDNITKKVDVDNSLQSNDKNLDWD